MAEKILILIAVLAVLILTGAKVFKNNILRYNSLFWAWVEFGWYMISFAAVCIGLIEIERIAGVNDYRNREKAFQLDYQGKQNFLYAQTWLLKSDTTSPPHVQESIYWFHKMKTLLDEGWQSRRWENFVQYSRYYIFREPGTYADVLGSMAEFNWPVNREIKPEELFLRDEIRTVVDTLSAMKLRKQSMLNAKPDENTNYKIRYVLVFVYLAGLSLKLLKIYADYRKTKVPK